MQRKFVIVLVIQTVLILTALAFGFVKNAEKERMTEIANHYAKLAAENEMKANELREELENCR